MAGNENLARLINMVLLKQGGQLKIDQLHQDLTKNQLYRNQGVQIPDIQSLLIFLKKFPRNFVINTVRHRRKKVSDVCVISDIETCVEHCKKQRSCHSQNGECGRLHICQFFLLSGRCHFDPRCAFGHDFTSQHNFNVFMSHMLNPRSIEENVLRDLLCRNECRNATTMPDTCNFYNTSNTCSKKKCRNLHICRHFLEGTCKFGSGCRKNHSVEETSVMDILEDYGFDVDRHPEVILEDLQNFYKNNTSTNIGSSQPSGLSYRSRSVNNLADPPRMSVFDPPPQRQRGRSAGRQRERDRTSFEGHIGSVERYRIQSPQPDDFSSDSDREQEAYVPTLRRPPSAVPVVPVPRSRTKQSPLAMVLPSKPTFRSVSKESTLKICIHYLRGKCLFGGKCRYHHKSTIYQWQWKRNTDLDWTDFDKEKNITLEKSFSHVEEAECYLKMGKKVVRVGFDTMSVSGGNISSVQRLTTISSKNSPPNIQEWTTIWHWYWQDENGIWKEYGDPDRRGRRSELDSDMVEERYLENPDGSIKFGNGRHQYILYFTDMQQMNKRTQTMRDVRRRPTFFHPEDIRKRSSEASADISKSFVPKEWNVSGEDVYGHYRKTVIKQSSQEFKLIDKLFHTTMPQGRSVKSLERIENGELWNSFCLKREQMKRKLGKDVVERQLFHGTHVDNIEAICRQGFDFRFCGKAVGTLHGKGSYFSTEAGYSDSYTVNCGKMFIALTLVGDFSKGNQSFVRPPPKIDSEPHGDLFDSCVDNVKNPKIFVIFDLYQVYPQYLITYE
ncbi:protein mono-ADP-ribosyltransferase PARP12-like [Gigantopelta aegis]|uniref:protein mono-ADP-ribosyltransferase PARP12-like n=1 Tax=Gigantopelta aegis TaxID=1735272 RepID=UPI001B88A4BF|nr:protein mono-ADP-ribosyltransferase PARP12-like [Gigantopelta aegis]